MIHLHTQRRNTGGRTLLDEWSARRRYLYLTTHSTYKRQTSMPPVGFKPTIPASERPQTNALESVANGIGTVVWIKGLYSKKISPSKNYKLINIEKSKKKAKVVVCCHTESPNGWSCKPTASSFERHDEQFGGCSSLRCLPFQALRDNFSYVTCPAQLAAKDVPSGRMNRLHLLKWFIEIFLGNRRS